MMVYNATRPAMDEDFGISTDDFFTLNHFLSNQSAWQRIENMECIEAYGGPLVVGLSDVVVVSSQPNMTNPVLDIIDVEYNADYVADNSWICSMNGTEYVNSEEDDAPKCDIKRIAANATNWTIYDALVSHCLTQPIQPNCGLRYSTTLMLIVIVCTLVKVLCIALALWRMDRNPLMTIGDAIASFLDDPGI